MRMNLYGNNKLPYKGKISDKILKITILRLLKNLILN